ncbi:acyltransferase family protein [Alsobacter sp. R-9]
MTIGEALKGPHNNFGLLRLVLAALVIVSHAFSLTTGNPQDEPLAHLTGLRLGEHAVNGFFVISGFLVTMSLDARGTRDYLVSRLLRIGPGVVVATLFVALVIGPLLTTLTLSAYFGHPGVGRFIVETLTQFRSNTRLPGLFESNPYRFPMGTVWTLRYESLFYLALAGLGLVGLMRAPRLGLALAAALFVALVVVEGFFPQAGMGLRTALRLAFLFTAGGVLYLERHRVRLSLAVVLGLAAAAWAVHGTALTFAVMFAAQAYGILWLALAPPVVRPEFEFRDDPSYGIYLYGWPIQQSLYALFPTASAVVLLVPSLVLSWIVGMASWRLVERPALGWKARLCRPVAPRTGTPEAPGPA